jgi:tRNA-splicing ligase RtcB
MGIPANLLRSGPAVYELPIGAREGMRVPARIFASEKLVGEMDDQVFVQAANVATLPGIVRASLVMPDAHWGYGFPIGGVAAIDPNTGVISPGGIGFDINCGMRLVRSHLVWPEVEPRLRDLVDALAARVPAGVGSKGFVRLADTELEDVLREGARWAVRRGFGSARDLAYTEAGGCISGANPSHVSDKAMKRGRGQIGTLGSGNHYLEIQVLRTENVVDAALAEAFGLGFPEQVVVMFHCGSRGFGHQVATDYLEVFLRAMPTKFGLQIIDRELACAPFHSEEGQAYFAAMACAANMAFANRQVILHRIREVLSEVFQRSPEELGLEMVYDVAHNIAKLERHALDGQERELLVHRKGATRAFPPGHPELPEAYRQTGQPVILAAAWRPAPTCSPVSPAGRRASTAPPTGSRSLARTEPGRRA